MQRQPNQIASLGVGDLAARLMRFFHAESPPTPRRSLSGFLRSEREAIVRDLGETALNSGLLSLLCRSLVNEGQLVEDGRSDSDPPPMNACFWAPQFNAEFAETGGYDFIARGFAAVRHAFSKSVIPIEVVRKDGALGLGTGFLLANHWLVTARHCVVSHSEVRISGWPEDCGPPEAVYLPADERIDLALIRLSEDQFTGIPRIAMGRARLLDRVLVMGYPPIPGFQDLLVAQTAEVAATLKSSTGEVVAGGAAYLDELDYLLINARVKGGSSGGPVLGSGGVLVGMTVQTPAVEDGTPDALGFGVALPSATIRDFVNAVGSKSGNLVIEARVSSKGKGFHAEAERSIEN